MTVFEKGVPGEAYNIGSGNECRNIDLVMKIIESVCTRIYSDCNPLAGLMRYERGIQSVKDNIKYVENARPGHDFRYAINHSKITDELGWEPSVNMLECIDKTVDWYLANQDWVENLKNRTK